MTLDNIKVLLSLSDDNSQDELLAILLDNASSTYWLYLDVPTIPDELVFIPEKVAVIKYRRI